MTALGKKEIRIDRKGFILVLKGGKIMFILSIMPIPLSEGNANPSDRLAEIRNKIGVAEQRVRDLEGLLTALILGTDTKDPVSGLNTKENPQGSKDANVVRQELYRARAYEGELRTAENFWNEIVSANKSAEQKTQEMFKGAGT